MSAKMQTKSDSQIQQEVLREMKWDTRVDENEIGVAVEQGVVTLTGAVGSYGKKIAAQEAAHRVFGVLDVANDVQVRLPGTMARSDTEIAQAVRSALEWDVWVPEERIKSTVSNGCVTLEGNVDLLREREDAERAIRGLAGVRAVTNKIEVKPSKVAADDLRGSDRRCARAQGGARSPAHKGRGPRQQGHPFRLRPFVGREASNPGNCQPRAWRARRRGQPVRRSAVLIDSDTGSRW